MHTSKANFKIL